MPPKEIPEAKSSKPKTRLAKTESKDVQGRRRYELLVHLSRNVRKGASETRVGEFVDIRKRFGARPATIVEDLAFLTQAGFVSKIRHGHYSVRKTEGPKEILKWIQEPLDPTRERIAKKCLTTRCEGRFLLGSRDCFICHGRSTQPIFRELVSCPEDQRPATIATNSIPGILGLLGNRDIRLNALGGRADAKIGAFLPQIDSVEKWVASVAFNVLVLSCSSVSDDLLVSCRDEMSEFRKCLIQNANERNAYILVIADISKLGRASPDPQHHVQLQWQNGRVWMFCDAPKDESSHSSLSALRMKLKDQLVTVPMADGRPRKKGIFLRGHIPVSKEGDRSGRAT